MSDKTKKEIETMDALVTRYNLPREICPNRSTMVQSGENIPSDMMFEHDAMFLVKRIAHMEMNYDSDKLAGFSPSDCHAFYDEHSLSSSHNFHVTFMQEGKKSLANWYFKGRSSTYINFLAYRWDNGMLFLNYKERVLKCLEVRNLEEANAARETIDRMKEIEDQVAALNGELDKLVKSQTLSPQLEQLLDGIDITVKDLIERGD